MQFHWSIVLGYSDIQEEWQVLSDDWQVLSGDWQSISDTVYMIKQIQYKY